MKQPSVRKKKRTVLESKAHKQALSEQSHFQTKHDRKEQKRDLSEWIRFQSLAKSYGEELRGKYTMGCPPQGTDLLLFSLELAWAEGIRQEYQAAQTLLCVYLTNDDKEGFSHLLDRYGPRLLAKDPLDPGLVLATLDMYWREDWKKLRKEDRAELYTYGITDKDIDEREKQERLRDRAFLRAIGQAFFREGGGAPKLPEEERESNKKANDRKSQLQRRGSRYSNCAWKKVKTRIERKNISDLPFILKTITNIEDEEFVRKSPAKEIGKTLFRRRVHQELKILLSEKIPS